MKILTAFVSVMMLASLAFGGDEEASGFGPNEPTVGKQVLSTDAIALARALTYPGVANEVAQFRANADIVLGGDVEELEDLTTFTLNGVILIGGDITCGHSKLTITRSLQPSSTGWGAVEVYSAKVDVERSHCP